MIVIPKYQRTLIHPDLSCTSESPLSVWMHDPWCRTPWYTASLSRALGVRGHAVRLTCPSYIYEPEYFRDQGLIPRPGVADLSRFAAFRKLGQPARLAAYLVNSAALHVGASVAPPQIIHQHQCVLLERGWRSELNLLRRCRKHGVKVVHTVHNLLPHTNLALHEPLYSELYHAADALICHDTDTASALSHRFRIPSERVHVVPHGPLFADVPRISPSEGRKALGWPPGPRVFLALGVLARYKGLDILLEAWAEFVRKAPHDPMPVLVIAGNGPETERKVLEDLSRRLKLRSETVRLDLRYIPASQIPLYQHAADVLLYPYRDITTSGALLTGLNYRKPIIASDLPPFREYLFAGENAMLVRPGDCGELAHALETMMDSSCYARLEAGSAANPDLVAQWTEISRQVACVYRTVLG